MNRLRMLAALLALVVAAGGCADATVSGAGAPAAAPAAASATAPPPSQVPTWSAADREFFLHGSMSTEFVPERVLRAFTAAYPNMFPRADLSHFGLIPDPVFGWPLGFSRREVPHLGGLTALGVNCAACHLGEVVPAGGGEPVRVIGMTSHFDAEAFFNSVIVATFLTADPPSMRRFLSEYLAAGGGDAEAERLLARQWDGQQRRIAAAIRADPFGARGVAAGGLHAIAPADLALSRAALEGTVDLPRHVTALLRLFHNMRAALHVPDKPPSALPPASGPGRNDAFGLLSAALFAAPQPYAPVKFGMVWNLEARRWVHWDGNTQSPIGRNLLAALGLGAPLQGSRGVLDVEAVQRHTDLTERIRAPRYPFRIDRVAAARGRPLFAARCASCHGGAESDARLHAPEAVGTDPARARAFPQAQAERFNGLLAKLEAPGYSPPKEPGLRGTQSYWATSLAGVWARSPYLHNGSVRTLDELLGPPAERPSTFHRGSRFFDEGRVGYVDEGHYVLDTRTPGNRNSGHDYGASLTPSARHDLIEYLKSL